MRSVSMSVCGVEVELLRWFCSGFDDKLPKKEREMYQLRSLKEILGQFSFQHVGSHDLKKKQTKLIHVTDCT